MAFHRRDWGLKVFARTIANTANTFRLNTHHGIRCLPCQVDRPHQAHSASMGELHTLPGLVHLLALVA